MALHDAWAGLRNAYQALSEREQRLVASLAFVLGALALVVPLLLLARGMSDLEDETTAYANVLREIGRAEEQIAQKRAQTDAAERRYRTSAPPLRTFLTRMAEGEGLTVERVDDQPGKTSAGFKRRHVSKSLLIRLRVYVSCVV